MDKIEPRVHDEINDYSEKMYGLTLRQWIFVILIGGINIPLYIYLSPIISEDMASWLIILIACPLGFIGFVPVQELKAEKVIPYWYRHFMVFGKPLKYKTIKESEEEKKNKGKNGKQKKTKKEKITKTSKKKSKAEVKIAKQEKKRLRLERKNERELAQAKKKIKPFADDFSPEEREKLRKLMENQDETKGENHHEEKEE